MSLARPAGRRSGTREPGVRNRFLTERAGLARLWAWEDRKAHLVEADGYARQLVKEYRRQIDQAFGQVIPSPWDDLRQGLVLGGESLWNRARELLDQAEGHEEIRWRRRADGDEVSRLIASLVAQEADRRVAIWLRVRVGGQRMTELAKEYGYRDGSGVHRVVHRLEEAAKEDRDLAHRLQQLADRVSSVKS